MPGPIWNDRIYTGMFGDPYMENTELDGGDQKRGGDVAALVHVTWFILQRLMKERVQWLTHKINDQPIFTDIDIERLEKISDLLHTNINMAKAVNNI
jgi:hypothetical protein